MKSFQDRQRSRDIFNSPAVAVFLLIVVVFLVRSDYDVYKKNQIAEINRSESDRRLSLLKEQNDRLVASLAKIKTDRGVEEELRNKFQIMKPGEEVLVVVDQPAAGAANGGGNETVSNDASLWQKVRSFLGL